MEIKHIKQNDPNCYPIIQKIGCFHRSCGLVAEYQTGKMLTAKDINTTWDWAKGTGRIDAEDNVKDSASIINRFLRVLGDTGRFYEVGTFKDGKLNWYPSIAPEYRKADALIQKIKQPGPSKTHFRVVDKYGNLLEDPHDPIITVNEVCYSILYCYVKGE